MPALRKVFALGTLAIVSLAAYATCDDIKQNCAREFNRDNAYCNAQPAHTQTNCFARSHERFLSCVGTCK